MSIVQRRVLSTTDCVTVLLCTCLWVLLRFQFVILLTCTETRLPGAGCKGVHVCTQLPTKQLTPRACSNPSVVA